MRRPTLRCNTPHHLSDGCLADQFLYFIDDYTQPRGVCLALLIASHHLGHGPG